MSKIAWTDITWNPVTGCTPISAGCQNCYAKPRADRLSQIDSTAYKYRNKFDVTCHREELRRHFPGKGKKIFVCSMSDLFHEDVPWWFVDDIFDVIKANKHHTFQILTKRPKRMYDYFDSTNCRSSDGAPFENVWLGITAENQEMLHKRLPLLCAIPCPVKFVSLEPMLEKIVFGNWIALVDQVICGGETGAKARILNPDWVISVLNECIEVGTAFFFKQWGAYSYDKISQSGYIYDPKIQRNRSVNADDLTIGDYVAWKVGAKRAGNRLHGQVWEQFPGAVV